MNFWASSETDAKTGKSVRSIRNRVEPHLNALLAASSLSSTPGEIRYVPIVMPPAAQARYPARSRLRKKDRVYVCAPQLDYDMFLTEDANAQLACYLAGLRECAGRLPDLGATNAQAEEFVNLLERCLTDLRE